MTVKRRVFALFLVLMLFFCASFPISALDDSDFDLSDDGGGSSEKVYSYNYDEEKGEASIHLHNSYAEKGNVDLRDAFVETAGYYCSLYINLGNVKLFLSAKTVADTAEKGEPVMLYVKKLVAEEEADGESEASDTETETEADKNALPSDVLYEISLGGIEFEYHSLKIQLKHRTDHAERLRILASDESGVESELKWAYSDALVSFFPESGDFTLRITEEARPDSTSKLLLLLAGALGVLIVLSAVTAILLKKGTVRKWVTR